MEWVFVFCPGNDPVSGMIDRRSWKSSASSAAQVVVCSSQWSSKGCRYWQIPLANWSGLSSSGNSGNFASPTVCGCNLKYLSWVSHPLKSTFCFADLIATVMAWWRRSGCRPLPPALPSLSSCSCRRLASWSFGRLSWLRLRCRGFDGKDYFSTRSPLLIRIANGHFMLV